MTVFAFVDHAPTLSAKGTNIGIGFLHPEYFKEVLLFPRMIKNLLSNTVCVTNVWLRSQLQLKTTNFYTQVHSSTAFELHLNVLREFTELRDKDTATTSFTSLLNMLIMA